MNGLHRARDWARSLLPKSPRSLIPPRSGWLRLPVSFSTYVLFASALATVVGKALALQTLEGVRFPAFFLVWAVAQDLLIYFGVAALLSALEMRLRFAWLITFPLALGVAFVAMLNTGYLAITGEQATWEAFNALFSRLGDAFDITEEVLTPDIIARIVGGLMIGVMLPVGLRFALKRRKWSFERRLHGHARMACAGWLAFFGLVVLTLTPRPPTVPGRNLGKNALLSTLRTMVLSLDTGTFTAYNPVRLVAAPKLTAYARREERPNVLVIVLESTRFDRTSLSGGENVADTPTLLKLSQEGLFAPRARSVLPHTTKSLFSILCGRFPLMQKKVVEVSGDLKIQCLPGILDEAGYETAFFQSSWGTFEWRPRLVHRLGFRYFKAWEDIKGQELGYLASDDESLVAPFGKWLDEIGDQPFMATILTSATHHPYRLSKVADKAAKAAELPKATEEERYLRLIEAEDRMIAGMLEHLERRGVRDKTIVVLLGDHGEGFGAKGVKQHDNNFYEEGLRVPLVIVGPGVPVREVPGNASLVDVTPTLLSLLDIELDREGKKSLHGHDLTDEAFPGHLPRYFSCWFEMRCRGFVVGDHKVVYEPQADEAWYYDLAADPEESDPRPLTPALEKELKKLEETLVRFRARNYKVSWGKTLIGEWRCNAKDSNCRHPGAKKKKLRYKKPAPKKDAKKAPPAGETTGGATTGGEVKATEGVATGGEAKAAATAKTGAKTGKSGGEAKGAKKGAEPAKDSTRDGAAPAPAKNEAAG